MDKKLAIAPAIKSLKVGRKICFPLERYNTVAKTVSDIRMLYGWGLVTSRDRQRNQVVVSRHS